MANKTHIVRNNSSDGTKTKTLRLRYTLNGKKPPTISNGSRTDCEDRNHTNDQRVRLVVIQIGLSPFHRLRTGNWRPAL